MVYKMQAGLKAPEAISEEIRELLRPPEGFSFRLHSGPFPEWLETMPWSVATVSCGDRLFREPAAEGFSMVIADEGGPIGYISASLRDEDASSHVLCVEMIQVSAARRGEGVGTALIAGIAQIVNAEILACEADGRYAPDFIIEADTQGIASGVLIDRLTQAIESLVDMSADRVDARQAEHDPDFP